MQAMPVNATIAASCILLVIRWRELDSYTLYIQITGQYICMGVKLTLTRGKRIVHENKTGTSNEQ